jgi:large subunit ribosomal protein L2
MGKMLKQQRRGKGSNAYAKKPGAFKTSVGYPNGQGKDIVGEVVRFINDPGHTAPLMEVLYEDFTRSYLLAPEGIKVGDKLHISGKPVYGLGNVLKLGDIPEGTPVYNIESVPGDGGKFARSAGSAAYIVAHTETETTLTMPSKGIANCSSTCRAQLGILAGGGMTDVPLVKAGKAYHIQKPLNRRWPHCRGVKMNAVDHPFGGKQHHKGRSSSTSRNAPPGRKVGNIAAKRMGRRKR